MYLNVTFGQQYQARRMRCNCTYSIIRLRKFKFWVCENVYLALARSHSKIDIKLGHGNSIFDMYQPPFYIFSCLFDYYDIFISLVSYSIRGLVYPRYISIFCYWWLLPFTINVNYDSTLRCLFRLLLLHGSSCI